MGLHGYTRVFTGLQGFTWVYMGIHRYTGVFIGIHGFTWVY